MLEPVVDLKQFTQGLPKWHVYANEMQLDKGQREKQILMFWDCMSGEFLKIVHKKLLKPTALSGAPVFGADSCG